MGIETKRKQHSITRDFFLLLFLFGFMVSFLMHLLFYQKAKQWEISSFSTASYDTIVPRTFRMKRVEIDPKTLEQEKVNQQPEKPKKVPILLQKEMPHSDPSLAQIDGKSILVKPRESIIGEKGNNDAKNSATSTKEILEQVDKMQKSPLQEESLNFPEPQEKLKTNDLLLGIKKTVPEGMQGTQQFSNLDDLLADPVGVKSNTVPILMPTDLLFEYDSDTLKTGATESLTKLGSLIKKNTQAVFKIEGHTDSFGSDDYNMQLSLRRAEAVKNWLILTMGIDAVKISTVGFGKTKLLVSSTGTVAQQQINRRVEIVISFPK